MSKLIYKDGEVYLDDTLEAVDVARARKIFKLCRKCRKSGDGMRWFYLWHEDINDTFSGFSVHNISKRGTLSIGCKKITWKQMLPVAKAMGFKHLEKVL